MTVSFQKVVSVTLPQLDITFQLTGMEVFGFHSINFFSVDFPSMREFMRSKPWAVFTGVVY
jgi:hypothetical protein